MQATSGDWLAHITCTHETALFVTTAILGAGDDEEITLADLLTEVEAAERAGTISPRIARAAVAALENAADEMRCRAF